MRKVVCFVALMCAMTAMPAVGQTEDAGSISLYNFNINKMNKNWQGWIAYVADSGLRVPDLILMQDLESRTERLRFQTALTEAFGDTWRGYGTGHGWHAAVIWREGRFRYLKARSWRGFGDPKPDDGREECRDGNFGAPAIQVRLRDKVAQRYVTAASFKTPPKETPETCPWKNAMRVDRALREQYWSGGLLFMGTDQNSSDWNEDRGTWRCWYAGVNAAIGSQCRTQANLGYTDPIYDLCAGDWAGCLDGAHDTHRNKAHTSGGRIDFLFGRTASGTAPEMSEQQTLPWGDPEFSDHRSIHAVFSY